MPVNALLVAVRPGDRSSPSYCEECEEQECVRWGTGGSSSTRVTTRISRPSAHTKRHGRRRNARRTVGGLTGGWRGRNLSEERSALLPARSCHIDCGQRDESRRNRPAWRRARLRGGIQVPSLLAPLPPPDTRPSWARREAPSTTGAPGLGPDSGAPPRPLIGQ